MSALRSKHSKNNIKNVMSATLVFISTFLYPSIYEFKTSDILDVAQPPCFLQFVVITTILCQCPQSKFFV